MCKDLSQKDFRDTSACKHCPTFSGCRLQLGVCFKIPVHGIFREWAVGFGQPRVAGKYVSANSRVKRTMEDWIDKPIEKNMKKLFDLATEFLGDTVVVNSFGAKKV